MDLSKMPWTPCRLAGEPSLSATRASFPRIVCTSRAAVRLPSCMFGFQTSNRQMLTQRLRWFLKSLIKVRLPLLRGQNSRVWFHGRLDSRSIGTLRLVRELKYIYNKVIYHVAIVTSLPELALETYLVKNQRRQCQLFQAMREIVDRYFGDSWVVAYALGPRKGVGLLRDQTSYQRLLQGKKSDASWGCDVTLRSDNGCHIASHTTMRQSVKHQKIESNLSWITVTAYHWRENGKQRSSRCNLLNILIVWCSLPHAWFCTCIGTGAWTGYPGESVLLHTGSSSISMYWYRSVIESCGIMPVSSAGFFGRLHCWPDADVGHISRCQTGNVGVVIAGLISALDHEGRYTSVDNDHFIILIPWQLCCEAIGNAITGSTVRQLQERHQERLADAQTKLKECLLGGRPHWGPSQTGTLPSKSWFVIKRWKW